MLEGQGTVLIVIGIFVAGILLRAACIGVQKYRARRKNIVSQKELRESFEALKAQDQIITIKFTNEGNFGPVKVRKIEPYYKSIVLTTKPHRPFDFEKTPPETSDFLFLKENSTVRFRVLPPVGDMKVWYANRKCHYPPGSNQGTQCGKHGPNQICIICDHYKNLWAKSQGMPWGCKEQQLYQNTARSIKPVNRYYCNVLVHDPATKQYDPQPKIFAMGTMVFEQMKQIILCGLDEGEKEGIYYSLGEGFDFKVSKILTGPCRFPRFDVSLARGTPKPEVGSPDEVLARARDLENICNKHWHRDPEQVRKALIDAELKVPPKFCPTCAAMYVGENKPCNCLWTSSPVSPKHQTHSDQVLDEMDKEFLAELQALELT